MSISAEQRLTRQRSSRKGEPTWELAELFPRQGEWTEEEYLALDSNRLIEFTDGVLEFLPMPLLAHGRISKYLVDRFREHVEGNGLGEVYDAPISVKLREGMLREPDVFVLLNERLARDEDPPVGADLVLEIVSQGSSHRQRDYSRKRTDYARAGIPEYWIVDPEERRMTVLTLKAKSYRVHGEFLPGQNAGSVLLPGFLVDVGAVFSSGERQKDRR